MDTGGGQRVGTAERTAAIEALNEHWRAGRLDPTEHEARTTKAHGAVTRADLDALFADLPALDGSGSRRPAEVAKGSISSPPSTGPEGGTSGLFPAQSWVGRHRDAIMGVTPFVATAAFFGPGHHWQWFLLIPALGATLYAGEERGHRRHRHRG